MLLFRQTRRWLVMGEGYEVRIANGQYRTWVAGMCLSIWAADMQLGMWIARIQPRLLNTHTSGLSTMVIRGIKCELASRYFRADESIPRMLLIPALWLIAVFMFAWGLYY